MIELLIGVAFAAFVLALPYIHERIGKDTFAMLKLPKLSRKEEVEKKIKEVDEKLEEVVNAGVSKNEAVEKVVPLDNAAESVQVEEGLLEEMETASTIAAQQSTQEQEEKLPEIPDLPELNSDLDMDFEDELKVGLTDESGESENEEEEGEEEMEEEEDIEFDEEDDLISSIAKEVEVKEEEEIDLLRDLKGQKFSAEELEAELEEILQKLKALAGANG